MAGGVIGRAIGNAVQAATGNRGGVTTIGFQTVSGGTQAGTGSDSDQAVSVSIGGAIPVSTGPGSGSGTTQGTKHRLKGTCASSKDGVAGASTATSSSDTAASVSASTNKRKMMYSVVNQLLSGSAPSSVVINDMPIEVMRSLVARQMGMAVQLLVQLLLQCQLNSSMIITPGGVPQAQGQGPSQPQGQSQGQGQDPASVSASYLVGQVEAQCHKCFLELYNHKDVAARRCQLTALGMRNVQRTLPRKIRRRLLANSANSDMSGSNGGYGGCAHGNGVPNGYDDDARVVTRSHYSRNRTSITGGGVVDSAGLEENADEDEEAHGGHLHGLNFSIFNVPLLRKYGTAASLFQNLDAQRVKLAQRAAETMQQRFSGLSTSDRAVADANADASASANVAKDSRSQRDILFGLIHDHCRSFCAPPTAPPTRSQSPIAVDMDSGAAAAAAGGSLSGQTIETENSNSCASTLSNGLGSGTLGSGGSRRPSRFRRHWECLHPSERYPLARSYIAQLYPRTSSTVDSVGTGLALGVGAAAPPSQPSALSDRCIFTPTEDDLLCKGTMSTSLLSQSGSRLGESSVEDWAKIVKEYLPNKNQPILEHRYRFLMSVHNADEEEGDSDTNGDISNSISNSNSHNHGVSRVAAMNADGNMSKYLRNNQTRMTIESEALRFKE